MGSLLLAVKVKAFSDHRNDRKGKDQNNADDCHSPVDRIYHSVTEKYIYKIRIGIAITYRLHTGERFEKPLHDGDDLAQSDLGVVKQSVNGIIYDIFKAFFYGS